MNIIRADIYRIVRGKGLYAVLVILLAVILMQVLLGTNVTTGVDVNSIEIIEEMDGQELEVSDFIDAPSGAEAPFRAMAGSANLLYLLLPLLVFIGCTDFNTGAAKNVLTCGISRARFYAAKLVQACVCCVLLMLLYVTLSIVLAVVFNGFGGTFNGEYIREIFKILLPQTWLLLAGVCVGHMIVFAVRRTAAVIGLYIAFLLVPAILLVALSFVSGWFKNLYDYELTISIGVLSGISEMSGDDIIRVVIVGGVYMFVAVSVGFMLFRKAEIK